MYNERIRMVLGIIKCTVLPMTSAKSARSYGIAMPGGEIMKSTEEDGRGKYLSILQAVWIK